MEKYSSIHLSFGAVSLSTQFLHIFQCTTIQISSSFDFMCPYYAKNMKKFFNLFAFATTSMLLKQLFFWDFIHFIALQNFQELAGTSTTTMSMLH